MHPKSIERPSHVSANTLTLRQELVEWLSQFLEHSQSRGFVIGMSGGVDSSTLAMLARDAAKQSHRELLGLMLPIDNAEMQEPHAKNQCGKFGIAFEVVPLQPSFASLKDEMPVAPEPVLDTNLKARLRECALYYYANLNNYLVLSTVNAGEYTTGYFPKHGVAGDLMPFATLLKREIRDIARSYGLPEAVVTAKASGCVAGRSAEEEWGFSEDELDNFVRAYELGEHAVWALKTVSETKKSEFLKMHRTSHHKRLPFPIFHRSRNH